MQCYLSKRTGAGSGFRNKAAPGLANFVCVCENAPSTKSILSASPLSRAFAKHLSFPNKYAASAESCWNPGDLSGNINPEHIIRERRCSYCEGKSFFAEYPLLKYLYPWDSLFARKVGFYHTDSSNIEICISIKHLTSTFLRKPKKQYFSITMCLPKIYKTCYAYSHLKRIKTDSSYTCIQKLTQTWPYTEHHDNKKHYPKVGHWIT